MLLDRPQARICVILPLPLPSPWLVVTVLSAKAVLPSLERVGERRGGNSIVRGYMLIHCWLIRPVKMGYIFLVQRNKSPKAILFFLSSDSTTMFGQIAQAYSRVFPVEYNLFSFTSRFVIFYYCGIASRFILRIISFYCYITLLSFISLFLFTILLFIYYLLLNSIYLFY